MRMLALSMVFSFGLAGQALAVKDAAEVRRILDRYMAVTHPKSPSKTAPYDREADAKVNQAQAARRAILAELRDVPGEAMSVVGQVLSQLASPKQRFEIVGTLGDHTHTRGCAELLHRVLQDVRTPQDEEAALYEELVRSSAVHGLRMMSRRTHRSGGQRSRRKPDFEAKVPGLVAYLIFAANDEAGRGRGNAMYA
ncbi:MAG: hypothetical protein HN380_14335, partial [Victivallales bacterium]|nr:hypothetical protein [Victivallales bacterium]